MWSPFFRGYWALEKSATYPCYRISSVLQDSTPDFPHHHLPAKEFSPSHRNFSFLIYLRICSTLKRIYSLNRGNHHIYHNRWEFFPRFYRKNEAWNFELIAMCFALKFFYLIFPDKSTPNIWSELFEVNWPGSRFI